LSLSGTPPPLVLFGVPFHNVTLDEALSWIAARARSGRSSQIVTTNLDFILQAWKDPEMHRIHFEADLVVADGWPPVAFSKFLTAAEERAREATSCRARGGARDQACRLALGASPRRGRRCASSGAVPGLRGAGAGPAAGAAPDMDHAALRGRSPARGDILLAPSAPRNRTSGSG
jgi:hypothetical protein